jgi:hypothetical protein
MAGPNALEQPGIDQGLEWFKTGFSLPRSRARACFRITPDTVAAKPVAVPSQARES